MQNCKFYDRVDAVAATLSPATRAVIDSIASNGIDDAIGSAAIAADFNGDPGVFAVATAAKINGDDVATAIAVNFATVGAETFGTHFAAGDNESPEFDFPLFGIDRATAVAALSRVGISIDAATFDFVAGVDDATVRRAVSDAGAYINYLTAGPEYRATFPSRAAADETLFAVRATEIDPVE